MMMMRRRNMKMMNIMMSMTSIMMKRRKITRRRKRDHLKRGKKDVIKETLIQRTVRGDIIHPNLRLKTKKESRSLCP